MKEIRKTELFAGMGAFDEALTRIEVPFTRYFISEWAIDSIQAFNDMHTKDYTDYSKDIDYKAICEYLAYKGISMDHVTPLTVEQIYKLGKNDENKVRTIFNNMVATHNLGDISKV